jgi:hypothetical protein
VSLVRACVCWHSRNGIWEEYRVVTWVVMRPGLLRGWLVFSGRVCKRGWVWNGVWGTGTFVITVDSATDPRTSVILGYASRDTSLEQWLKVQRMLLSVFCYAVSIWSTELQNVGRQMMDWKGFGSKW